MTELKHVQYILVVLDMSKLSQVDPQEAEAHIGCTRRIGRTHLL